jgi:hypothetical protein
MLMSDNRTIGIIITPPFMSRSRSVVAGWFEIAGPDSRIGNERIIL